MLYYLPKKGGVTMYNSYGYGCAQPVSPVMQGCAGPAPVVAGAGYGPGYGAGRGFALIVVLFILLIIIGAAYVSPDKHC